MRTPVASRNSAYYGRVPGLPRNAFGPEGSTDTTIRRGPEGLWHAEGGLGVVKNAEGWWVYGESQPKTETAYFAMNNTSEGSIYVSRFMNPNKWNGPMGRNELQPTMSPASVYGNYIQDELIARTSAGASFSSVIDQTRPSGRVFLDFWQLPEDIDQLEDYNIDYENLWIPARFEVIDYKYKETARFIHGSTDLFKDKEGVMQTLSEINSLLESVNYVDGPWDALHREYRDSTSIHFGWGYKHHWNYTYDTLVNEYLPMHFTKLGQFGQPVKHNWHGGTPINGGIAESQTWKDCIDRALVMIANWPTLHNAEDEVFEDLQLSSSSWNGAQAYDSHLNPYHVGSSKGKDKIRWDNRAMEHMAHEHLKYSIWWWDLACLIANEYDNNSVFTTADQGPRAGSSTSALSDMLSFNDQWRSWRLGGDDGGGYTGNPPTGDWPAWQNSMLLHAKDTPSGDRGFWGRFYYGNAFASGHRQGYTSGVDSDWDVPLKRVIGPDILPPITHKRRDSNKARVTELACYRDMLTKPGTWGREKLERIIQEAQLLLECRDKYNLSIDPSTLSSRGKSLYLSLIHI